MVPRSPHLLLCCVVQGVPGDPKLGLWLSICLPGLPPPSLSPSSSSPSSFVFLFHLLFLSSPLLSPAILLLEPLLPPQGSAELIICLPPPHTHLPRPLPCGSWPLPHSAQLGVSHRPRGGHGWLLPPALHLPDGGTSSKGPGALKAVPRVRAATVEPALWPCSRCCHKQGREVALGAEEGMGMGGRGRDGAPQACV